MSSIANIEEKDQEKISRLIDLILEKNSKYTKEQLENNFDRTQLEGILEYGDHRAFWKKEFDKGPVFYDNKGKSSIASGKIANDYTKITEDLNLAKKLGGDLMANRVKSTVNSKDREYDSKQKIILQILSTLPEKFNSIKKIILDDDLHQIIEICRGINRNKIKLLLIVLVEERAKNNGMYVSEKELQTHFGYTNRKGKMKSLHTLRQAGLLSRNELKEIKAANIAAENLLFEMAEKRIIDRKILILSKEKIKQFPDMYPTIYRGRVDIGIVVALTAIRMVDQQFGFTKLSEVYCKHFLNKKETIPIYQALKRADRRIVMT